MCKTVDGKNKIRRNRTCLIRAELSGFHLWFSSQFIKTGGSFNTAISIITRFSFLSSKTLSLAECVDDFAKRSLLTADC
jgi:hypothetical protein